MDIIGLRVANRHLELDANVFRRSRNVISRSLRGGRQRTRQELKAALDKAGIRTDVQRLAHIVIQAELDAVICSGARRDGQFTYALLDERVAPTPSRSRDDSLAELTRRYFRSHGPAQVSDFVWWSGLTTADARRGRLHGTDHPEWPRHRRVEAFQPKGGDGNPADPTGEAQQSGRRRGSSGVTSVRAVLRAPGLAARAPLGS